MEKQPVAPASPPRDRIRYRSAGGHPPTIATCPIACIEHIESSGRGGDRLALLRAQGLTKRGVVYGG